MRGGVPHNLIAHLARRVLAPPGVRPRPPSRFESPFAGAPSTEFGSEDVIPAPTPAETPRAPVSAREPREERREPEPVEPSPPSPRDEATPAPRPGHAPPTPARREPAWTRIDRTVRYPIPSAPVAVDHRISTPVNDNPENPPPPTHDPPREASQPPPGKVERANSVPRQRLLPVRVLERLHVHTERFVTPSATVTAVPRPAPSASAPARPVERSAAPTVEIHIGRVEVQPHSPGLPAPAKNSGPPRRSGTQSLEEYLRSRTRERRGGP